MYLGEYATQIYVYFLLFNIDIIKYYLVSI